MINDHVESFAGLPVFDVTEENDFTDLPAPGSVAWRLRIEDWTEDIDDFKELWGRFLEHVDTAAVTALIIGNWGAGVDIPGTDMLEIVLPAAERLPALTALFVGEMLQEESEISWIRQGDLTPVFAAFPGLREVVIRGGTDLSFQPLKSAELRKLRIEAGGLPAEVVRSIGASELPELESLELWLGVEDYGGDSTVADLAPFLSGERLPALRHLGLQNSPIMDDIAVAVAGAPVVARLESLALSMGSLSDTGAEALLSGQPLGHLKSLDLHHHYMSDEMTERVRAAFPTVEVNVEDQHDREDDWRYVEVSE